MIWNFTSRRPLPVGDYVVSLVGGSKLWNHHFNVILLNPFKKKCEDLEEKARGNEIELEKVHSEMNEYRKQVSSLEMELESLRGTNEYLERNLAGE